MVAPVPTPEITDPSLAWIEAMGHVALLRSTSIPRHVDGPLHLLRVVPEVADQAPPHRYVAIDSTSAPRSVTRAVAILYMSSGFDPFGDGNSASSRTIQVGFP